MKAHVLRHLSLVGSASLALIALTACTVRDRRPDGPNREAEELVDALSDAAVDCTKQHSPTDAGQIIILVDISQPGAAPIIRDAGSTPPANPAIDDVIQCVRGRASQNLHNPKTAPGPYAEIRVPLPLVTSKVSYVFKRDPAAGS